VGGGWGGGGAAARAPCLPNVYKLGNSNVTELEHALTFHCEVYVDPPLFPQWNVNTDSILMTFHRWVRAP
jgi:hypothetical protein